MGWIPFHQILRKPKFHSQPHGDIIHPEKPERMVEHMAVTLELVEALLGAAEAEKVRHAVHYR